MSLRYPAAREETELMTTVRMSCQYDFGFQSPRLQTILDEFPSPSTWARLLKEKNLVTQQEVDKHEVLFEFLEPKILPSERKRHHGSNVGQSLLTLSAMITRLLTDMREREKRVGTLLTTVKGVNANGLVLEYFDIISIQSISAEETIVTIQEEKAEDNSGTHKLYMTAGTDEIGLNMRVGEIVTEIGETETDETEDIVALNQGVVHRLKERNKLDVGLEKSKGDRASLSKNENEKLTFKLPEGFVRLNNEDNTFVCVTWRDLPDSRPGDDHKFHLVKRPD